MKIQIRARYEKKPKIGLIRVNKISKNQPMDYSLQLFDESINQPIRTIKSLFSTISLAISHAQLYGFNSNEWVIDEKEI